MTTNIVKRIGNGARIGAGTLAIGSVLLFTACASMQPSSVTIADALAAPDGTELVITGAVVQQMVEDEEVLLQDASGQIVAEVDDDLIGELQLNANTQLRIKGEVDRDEDRSVIVAESVQLVNP